MTKHVVEYDRPGCIGAGACTAASPKFWKINNNLYKNVNSPVLRVIQNGAHNG